MAFRAGRKPRRHSLSQLPESRNPGNEYLPRLALPSYRMDDFTLQLYAPEYGSYRPKLQVHRDDHNGGDAYDGYKDYDACSEKALADDDLDSVYGTDFLQSPTYNRQVPSSLYGGFIGGGGGGGITTPCCDQCHYYCHIHGAQAVISCPSTTSATAKRHSYTFGGYNPTMRQRPSPQQPQPPGFRHNSQRANYLSESYQRHERLRQLSEPRRQGSVTSKKSPARSRRSSYADGSSEPLSDLAAYGGDALEARPPPIASLGTLREHPERQRLYKTGPAHPGDDVHRRERWARRGLFGRKPRAPVFEPDEDEPREGWLSRMLSKASSQRRGGYRKTLWLNPYGF